MYRLINIAVDISNGSAPCERDGKTPEESLKKVLQTVNRVLLKRSGFSLRAKISNIIPAFSISLGAVIQAEGVGRNVDVRARQIRENLSKQKHTVVIGGNIGKNRDTANEDAYKDYEVSFNALYDHVDYFVVNVSSPNTPGLRELQAKEPLTKLLQNLTKLNRNKGKEKPILLKIAPDLSEKELDDIIDIVHNTGIAGIIATNTTITRDSLSTDTEKLKLLGEGGVSGKPLSKRSTEVIRYIVEKSQHTIPVIGVGGIHAVEDALEKFEAGAVLIQLYTGFIYEGPGLIKRIKKALVENAVKNVSG